MTRSTEIKIQTWPGYPQTTVSLRAVRKDGEMFIQGPSEGVTTFIGDRDLYGTPETTCGGRTLIRVPINRETQKKLPLF